MQTTFMLVLANRSVVQCFCKLTPCIKGDSTVAEHICLKLGLIVPT